MKKKKLLIKRISGTSGGIPGIHLGLDCTDGSSYRIPRDISRSELRDANIAVLEEDGEIVSIAKVDSFRKDGRPDNLRNLTNKPFELDGTEEIVDCR